MRRKRFGLQIRKFQPLVRVTEVTEVLEAVTGSVVWFCFVFVVGSAFLMDVDESKVLAVGA